MRPSARTSAAQRQARFQRIYDDLVVSPVDRDPTRFETSIDLRVMSALAIDAPDPLQPTEELISEALGIPRHLVAQFCCPYVGNPLYAHLQDGKVIPNEIIVAALVELAALFACPIEQRRRAPK